MALLNIISFQHTHIANDYREPVLVERLLLLVSMEDGLQLRQDGDGGGQAKGLRDLGHQPGHR